MANVKNIFTSVDQARYFIEEIDSSRSDITLRKQTLNKVETFLDSGSYSTYRNIHTFIDNRKKQPKELARIMGISIEGLRQARKRISDDAYTFLGDDIAEILKTGNSEQLVNVMRRIGLSDFVFTKDGYLLVSAEELIRRSGELSDAKYTFKLEDCGAEIGLLKIYTKKFLATMIEVVDSDKIRFIVRCLNGEEGINNELNVLKFLNNYDNDSIVKVCNSLRALEAQRIVKLLDSNTDNEVRIKKMITELSPEELEIARKAVAERDAEESARDSATRTSSETDDTFVLE